MCRFEMNISNIQAAMGMEFALHYQPLFDGLGTMVGMEALLRGNSLMFGKLSPAEFIPLAEESGAIFSIGEWILRTACLQRKYLQVKGLCSDSCYMAVNVSPCQLQQLDFVETFTNIVHETGVYPYQISIEITEGVLIKGVADISQKISKLRDQGFLVSIDDFGMGYSSLAYLKHFSIDALKIDRFFVQDLGKSRNSDVICRSIINLAKNLGIKTVAEGVETMVQVEFLQNHGCEAFQGYYFSKPLPALKINSFLMDS